MNIDTARSDEDGFLISALRSRTVLLNQQVQLRDDRILELEQKLAELQPETQEATA